MPLLVWQASGWRLPPHRLANGVHSGIHRVLHGSIRLAVEACLGACLSRNTSTAGMLNLGDAILLHVVRYDNFPVIEEPERLSELLAPSKFSILL